IDWCCLPEIDGPSIFGALLGASAGRFAVRVPGAPIGTQRYVGDTNVLETTLESPEGRVAVIDFMPISGNIDGRLDHTPPAEIHRILRAPGGYVAVEVEWSPRFNYGTTPTRIDRGAGWYIATPEDGS